MADTDGDGMGVPYPTAWNGKPNLAAMEGVSMAGMLKDGLFFCNPDRYLGFEMDGVKGLRQGNWKLSQKAADEKWYMFDVSMDPSETVDLADDPMFADKFAEMVNLYFNEYSVRNGVIPVSNKRLDFLGAVNAADNSASEAVFTGGDAVDGGIVQYAKNAQASTSSTHDIAAQLRPAPGDVGKPGEFYAFGSYVISNPDGSEDTFDFAFTPNGLEITPPATEVLPPPYLVTDSLPLLEFIPIYEGMLPDAGVITLNFGYTTEDGESVVSQEPMTITIAAAP